MKTFTVPKTSLKKSISIASSEVKRYEKALKEAESTSEKSKLKKKISEGNKFISKVKKLL